MIIFIINIIPPYFFIESMVKPLIKNIIILPVTGALFIPILLLYVTSVFVDEKISISLNVFALSVSFCFFVVGFYLGGVTTYLFFKIGKGTPAPWDPPKKFVAEGPYRYVRNPMILGMYFILLGEVFLFWSLSLFFWVVIFFIANAVYIPLIEEKALLRRFGNDYSVYMKNVRRWIPSLTPWKKK
jgi:protein-S-isoprenylcysteine O-methyltransferase Ste14